MSKTDSLKKQESIINEYPCISTTHGLKSSFINYEKYSSVKEEGQYIVLQLDIVGSTHITDKFGNKTSHKYVEILFEIMNHIAVKYHGAKTKAGEGDAVYYIWKYENESKPNELENVLDCALQMINARDYVNFKLYGEKLEPVDYRISGEYGNLVKKTLSDGKEDYDGKAMNYCAKINKESPNNGIIIGNDLYSLAKQLKNYQIEEFGYSKHAKSYPLFVLKSKRNGFLADPLRTTGTDSI